MIDYIEIFDTNRQLIGIVDDFQSVIFQTQYYGVGAFEVYISANSRNMTLFQIGNYILRNNDLSNIGIIETLKVIYSEQDGSMIVVTGRTAKSLLDRRLIFKLLGDSVTGKLSILPTVSRGLVEVAARNLVNSHIINSQYEARNVSFITLGALQGITKIIVDENGNATDKQTSFSNLLTYTDEMLQEYELGASLVFNRNNLNLEYTVYEGADRSRSNTQGNQPVIFSQDFDNLLTSNYAKDTSIIKNTALIGGEGEGTDRFCAMVGVNASGLNRREVWIDGSSQSKTYDVDGVQQTYTDTEYLALLKSAGLQTLATLQMTETYEGEININSTNAIFKTDFNVGDVVSIEDNRLGIYFNPRIISATEVQDQNGYSVNVSYGK